MANEPYQRVVEDNGIVMPLLGIGAGAGVAYASKDMVTGMKTLYHGTSKSNADKIKQEGFKASRGGTGGASATVGDKNFIKNSQGYIHATSISPYANFYANLAGDPTIKSEVENSLRDMSRLREDKNRGKISQEVLDKEGKVINRKEIKTQFKGILKPHSKKDSEILKIRMPFMEYDQAFKIDEDGGPSRFMAAKTSSDINPQYIKGGKGQLSLADKAKIMKKNTPDYVKKNLGRFSAGVAMLGLGVTGIGIGIKNLSD